MKSGVFDRICLLLCKNVQYMYRSMYVVSGNVVRVWCGYNVASQWGGLKRDSVTSGHAKIH